MWTICAFFSKLYALESFYVAQGFTYIYCSSSILIFYKETFVVGYIGQISIEYEQTC
jgi:hypothetical protein